MTGVVPSRDAFARLCFHAWRSILSSPNVGGCNESALLSAFAWHTFPACHSPAFLASYERQVPTWVGIVVTGNTVQGVGAIVALTHQQDEAQEPLARAKALRGDGVGTMLRPTVKIVVGAEDMLCGAATSRERVVAGAGELAAAAGGTFSVITGCGHNLPAEKPKEWRENLITFLNEEGTA